MKKEKDKSLRQPAKVVLKNNLFIIKLILKASPAFLIFPVLDSIRNQVSIFFEHTYGIGYVLEAAEYHYPFADVLRFILILAGAITLGMVFTVYAGDYIAERTRPKVREYVKMKLYEKAKEADLCCYDNPEYYNEMVLSISEADKQIERAVKLVQDACAGLAAFVSNGIYFLSKDKFSILFITASFAINFLMNQFYNRISFKIRLGRNPHERKRNYISRVFYLPDYAKEIRLNPGLAGILEKRFEDANDEVIKTEKKYRMKKFLNRFTGRYLGNHFFVDCLYISYLVLRATVLGGMSFSTVAILYNSFGRMKRSLNIFTEVYPYAAETSLYVQKIRNFLDFKSQIVSEKDIEPADGAKEVELRDVSFAYRKEDGDKISDVSLKIRPGEKIALVGYNGAGKTTLVKLLMRLYDVDKGEILADGINIKDYDLKKYRASIGTVFQDFKIFAGDVTENVIMDKRPQTDDDITKRVTDALAAGGLLERIMSSEAGLSTELTTEIMENGVNLSGGESQKLAISRVFYGKAGLMILDEPSSALDPIAEYQLNHAMLSETKDKSVIFISHRLSTTRLADRIYMLENGRIVESGSHEELLAEGGKYAEMWRVQAGAYI